jgi:predicted esterase
MNHMETLHPPTTVHGRVLVDRIADPAGALVGFHGYAQSAEDMLDELRLIPGVERWTRVSIQALHRFYLRGDSKVVANWMTRQDRELAIADNIAYVQTVIESVLSDHAGFSPRGVPGADAPGLRTIYVGFSQGVAMAYRAALHSSTPVAGIVALAGDIPPELKRDESLVWPRVLIGVGDKEQWYTPDKLAQDEAFLRQRGVQHEIVRFTGGHEWVDEFRAATAAFITR